MMRRCPVDLQNRHLRVYSVSQIARSANTLIYIHEICAYVLQIFNLGTAQTVDAGSLHISGGLKNVTSLEVNNGVVMHEWINWWNMESLEATLLYKKKLSRGKLWRLNSSQHDDKSVNVNIHAIWAGCVRLQLSCIHHVRRCQFGRRSHRQLRK